MKIHELIKILQTAPDRDALISIPSIQNNDRTENVWYSFDDVGNIELYEVSESFLNS